MTVGFWTLDWSTFAWAGIVVYFVIVEGAALLVERSTPRHDQTLSAHIWEWLGIYDGQVGKHVGLRRLVAVAVAAILIAHLFFRFM